ncbi:MAG: ATP-binding cassette domain-containing protein [bacterium]
MIEVSGLTKNFGSVQALQGVDFAVARNEVVGFLGPNGAGKTTTMRILTGFFPPDAGNAVIAGIDVKENSFQVREKIGYLPENNPLWDDLEVTESLRYHGQLRRIPPRELASRIPEMIERCGLEKAVGRPLSELSKGFRQRVGLAQALLHDPEILILDEPTSGLDPHQILEIRSLIREIGKEKTVLLSSHILPEVEATCGRIVIIHQGKTVGSGKPEELAARLKGKGNYSLTVRGDLEAIKKGLLSSLPLTDLKGEEGVDGFHHLLLFSNASEDLGEKIFQLVAQKGWALKELKKEEASLEEVFLGLTGN